MDKLIKYFNEHTENITLMYSTPSKYFEALNAENIEWDVLYDDMFPYADQPDAFWTGYFSSRANDKEYIRRGSHSLHASNKFYGYAMLNQSISDDEVQNILSTSEDIFDTMGVNQHHDAVTGTGKQAVANDYAWRIYKSLQNTNQVYSQLLAQQVSGDTGVQSKDGWQ